MARGKAEKKSAKASAAKAKAKGKKKGDEAVVEATPEVKEAAAPAAAPAGSKAQAVRDAMAANRSAGPKEIADLLKAQGYEITASYVSLVKWQDGKKKRKPKSGAKAVPAAAATGTALAGGLTIESLLQAKKLAEAMGGVETARKAIAALHELLG